MLATDLGAASARATDQAIDLAAQLGARLVVVNVIDPGRGGLLRPLARVRPVEEREDRSAAVQAVVRRARSVDVAATFLVWDGDPGDGILAAADAERADLIVVGSRGRGTVGRLLGSVSDAVVRRASVPVLVVGPTGASGAAGLTGAIGAAGAVGASGELEIAT